MKKFLLENRKKEDEYHARSNRWRTTAPIHSKMMYEEEPELDDTTSMMAEVEGSKELEEHIDRLVEEMWRMDIHERSIDGARKRTKNRGKKPKINVGGRETTGGESTSGGAGPKKKISGANRPPLNGKRRCKPDGATKKNGMSGMVMVEDVQDGLLTRMMVEDDCGDEEQTVGGLDLEVERTEETKEGANQAANPYGQGAVVGGGEVSPK